mgnify:CR=1 FL=1
MIIEITPVIVFGALGASAAVGGAVGGLVLFIADSRYFKQTDGAALQVSIAQLAEAIKGFTDTKNGMIRVHERLDVMSERLSTLLGSCGAGKC